LLKYDFFLLRKSWSETERDFLRLCPPGSPRRLPLDTSPRWVRRSQDGLTSKAYRMRDTGGWGTQRNPTHPQDREKRLIHQELLLSVRNREVTAEFVRLLKTGERRYFEFPLD
jgi:hypothetical protein